jgi:erythromycin esterase-like protein
MTDKPLTEQYSSVQDWIRAEALPVDMQSDEAFNEWVDQFAAALGYKVDMLGLGEALHGGEEILQFRNRLFRRLVERYGYRAIAIESSFPRSRVLDDFVTGRGAASYDDIQDSGFSHGFGRLTANRELAEWIRGHNAGLPDADKVHFYGFDAPTDMIADSPRHLLTFMLDYLASADPAAAEKHRAVIEPLLGEDALWENPEAAMNPALAYGLSRDAAALRLASENLISDLNERRPALAAAQGMDRFLEAVHYAAEARQLMTYHAVLAAPAPDRQGHLMSIRAAMMARNLSYIATRVAGGRVLIFAHNTHLQRRKVEWQFGEEQVHWEPSGAHLDTLYGTRYAAIATAVGASPDNGIAEPEAGTLEALLTEAGAPVTLIPTHRGRGIDSGALNALPSRSGSTKNWSYSALTPKHIADFDWLLMFREVTPYRRG